MPQLRKKFFCISRRKYHYAIASLWQKKIVYAPWEQIMNGLDRMVVTLVFRAADNLHVIWNITLVGNSIYYTPREQK